MSAAVLILACLMAILVAGQNEREEFDFGFEESLLFEESYNPAYTLPAVTAANFKDDSIVFTPSPKTDSDPVSEPEPEPKPKPEPAVTNSRPVAIYASDTKAARPYSFGYAVEDNKTGLDFGHKETSDGLVVTGTYYVLLPDGRKETVNYKADRNGYVAEVSYEGEAKFNDAQALPATGSASGTSGKLQVDSVRSGPALGVVTTAEPTRSALTSKTPSLQMAGHQSPTAPVGSEELTSKKPIANISSTASSAFSSTPSTTSQTSFFPTPIPSSTSSSTAITSSNSTPKLSTIKMTTETQNQTSIPIPITPGAHSNSTPTSVQISVPTHRIPSSTEASTALISIPVSTPTPNATLMPSSSNSGITSVPATSPTVTLIPVLALVSTAIPISTPMSILATTSTPMPRPSATPISTSYTVTPIPSIPPTGVTIPATIPILAQNLTSVPSSQFPGSRPAATPVSTTTSPNTSFTPLVVSKPPETSPSNPQSFSDALAAFVRSARPNFIHCRNLLPNCTTEGRPARASSKAEGLSSRATPPHCSYCISLKNTCLNLESGEHQNVSSVRNDTYQTFQALIPLAPVWPPITSPIAELARTTISSAKPETSTSSNFSTTPRPFSRSSESIDFSGALDEIPSDLVYIAQYAEIHLSYCRKIRPFCPQLESTRPYWEGSSEVPRKWKELFLSTAQSCGYCRSLWPLCSDLETSQFLLDPAQLFTLHALEEDVTDAVFTISYCRNMTENCAKLNATQYPQAFARQSPRGTLPVAIADPVPAQASLPGKKPISEPATKFSQSLDSESQDEGDLEGTKFVIFCLRLSSICSQLPSI